MNIIIKNRKEAAKMIFGDNEMVFSINTPGMTENPINAKNKHYMFFDDIDDNYNVPIIGHSQSSYKPVYFNNDMAIQALAYLDFALESKISTIYIHCDQGISRSPGMAVGFCKILGLDYEFFYKNYKPNDLVTNVLVSVFSSKYSKFKNISNFRKKQK